MRSAADRYPQADTASLILAPFHLAFPLLHPRTLSKQDNSAWSSHFSITIHSLLRFQLSQPALARSGVRAQAGDFVRVGDTSLGHISGTIFPASRRHTTLARRSTPSPTASRHTSASSSTNASTAPSRTVYSHNVLRLIVFQRHFFVRSLYPRSRCLCRRLDQCSRLDLLLVRLSV